MKLRYLGIFALIVILCAFAFVSCDETPELPNVDGEETTTADVDVSGDPSNTTNTTTDANGGEDGPADGNGETYTITYELGGGTNAEKNPATYTSTSKDIHLAAATLTGYTFDGWYSGETQVTKIAAGSTGNITLTAKFKLTQFNINYNLEGGTNAESNPASYTITGETIILSNPTRSDGYTFDGWYNGDTKVTEIPTGSTGDITLVAKWAAPAKYTIEFNANGGAGTMADKSYSYGQKTALPVNAFTKDGYIFGGWKDNKGKTYADAADIIKQPSDGDTVTLTAQWKPSLGFDVSEFQSGINFDTLKSYNPGYLILRSSWTGYGGTGTNKYEDICFEDFYAAAKARNIPVGAYHYSCANTYDEGKAEAEFMYENCLKGKTFEFPIYIDIENSQHQTGNYSGVTQAIHGFCDYIISKGYYPAVYTYASFCPNFNIAEIEAKYDVWVACYATDIVPYGIDALNSYYQKKGGETATIWQYTSGYGISGWSSGIDANYCYKDYETFIKRFGFNGFRATGTEKFKDNLTLAQEVLDGKWGIGIPRKTALIAAGYDYTAVMEAVNYLL